LAQYLTIPVVNKALGGRSARSFTEEGRFTEIANLVKPGDFVVMAFGHNDGSAGAVDNGRQCAVGDGYDTTSTVKTAK
jgi:rhamnogalacturonan acetylesterase